MAKSQLNAKYSTTVEGRVDALGISLISQAESELQSQMNQSMVRKKLKKREQSTSSTIRAFLLSKAWASFVSFKSSRNSAA